MTTKELPVVFSAQEVRDVLDWRKTMRTVKVRIALAVDPNGSWSAIGWNGQNGEPAGENAMNTCVDAVDGGEARYWIEATVPVPNGEQVVTDVDVVPA